MDATNAAPEAPVKASWYDDCPCHALLLTMTQQQRQQPEPERRIMTAVTAVLTAVEDQRAKK